MTNDSPLCHVIAGMFVMEFKSFASQDKAINFFYVCNRFCYNLWFDVIKSLSIDWLLMS